MARPKLDTFTRAYIEAALWSSTDNADDSGGEPLDKNYSASDIDPETMKAMVKDCADFQKRYGSLIEDEPNSSHFEKHGRWEVAGHDFWLSRNGHGAGFFDGDWPENGDKLQAAAEKYGQVDLQVDDGVISDGVHWTPVATEARRRPMARAPHRVADFSTIPELISHAQQEGATHVKTDGDETKLYFPRPDGQYEEACVWTEGGYWHTHAPGNRVILGCLPPGAEPIEGQVVTSNRRHTVRDYVAVDTRGRPVAGPFKDYGTAKGHADKAGGHVEFAMKEGRHGVAAARRPAGKPARGSMMTAGGVLMLAGELSKKVGGTSPEYIEGGHRWGDRNESARFTTYSPDHGQKVVVLVSIFEDNDTAIDFFSDEHMSETNRYENIAHFLYGPGGFTSKTATVDEMAKDVEWVWKTVDGYAESWGAGQDEVDEMRATRRKQAPSDEKIGAQYAQDQIGGEHFMIWVGDQIYEAEEMERREPGSTFPLKTRADYRKLARNMLQQLEWDTKRQMDASEIRALGVSDQKAFFSGFVEELKADTSVNWLADEIEAMHKSGRGEVSETSRRSVKTGPLVAVRLDDPKFPGNGGVVVAHPKSAAEFEKLITGRDGARDPNMRLWQGNAPIGTHVGLGPETPRARMAHTARRPPPRPASTRRRAPTRRR